MNTSHRVIINTVAQFIKTFISGILTLYSSRIILLSLGNNDYGIYSLVAGIILMLSFITNALSSTTQRFISYNHKNRELNVILTNGVYTHLFMGIVFCGILFALIPLLFNGFLNISVDRVDAAKFVYKTVLVSVFISFITSPYKAVLIAHENIIYVSIIDVLDAVLKLIIAFSLERIYIDKLEYYGLLLMCIQFINFTLITLYAFRHYNECEMPKVQHIKKNYLLKLSSFAGWNMYGLGCNICRTQGLSIVLNKFLGTVANAAYGIGIQISSYINYMSESLLNAIRPQIVKSEGLNNRERMFNLSILASKFSFFLLSMFSIPCIFEMSQLLVIWLKEPPEYAVLFSRMFLLSGLVDSITIGLHIANQAIGNLKRFVLIINSLKLLVLPISIGILKIGLPVVWVACVYVGVELFTALLRIFLIRKDGLNIYNYFTTVFKRISLPLIICLGLNIGITYFICSPYRILWAFIITFGVYGGAIYLWGISENERLKFKSLFHR